MIDHAKVLLINHLIALQAVLPGSTIRLAMASASMTGMPRSLNMLETVLLPVATPPCNMDDYPGYERSLKVLKIESLVDRRERLSLNFAKKCLNHVKFSDMFPKNTSKIRSRGKEKFHVNMANTERYKHSAMPFLQRKLNENLFHPNKHSKDHSHKHCTMVNTGSMIHTLEQRLSISFNHTISHLRPLLKSLISSRSCIAD